MEKLFWKTLHLTANLINIANWPLSGLAFGQIASQQIDNLAHWLFTEGFSGYFHRGARCPNHLHPNMQNLQEFTTLHSQEA